SSEAPFRLASYVENLYYHPVQATTYPLFKNPPYTLPLAVKMAEISKNYELDLLHVHYAIPHAASAYLARQILARESRAPKIITTLHGTDITLVGVDASFYDITKFSINESDGVTAVSKYLAEETAREFQINRPIEVIYNFYDSERFSARDDVCCKSDFASEGQFLIAHISNFRPVKRVPDVIDIFEGIHRALPSKLLLVGEGPDTTLVRRLVRRKGLEDDVTFLGTQVSVETILPCVDLFLLPSQEESFGLAALEAMACGAPLIGSLGSGISEVAENGVTGILHPVGDTGAMAASAVELLSDPARLKQFRDNSLRRASENFNDKRIVDHYERFYREVLAGAPVSVG
ncbi:MAG: N-acetyl-alpha-D-glucosaminyl L-malate synthase BshA, partial [Candidatus Zixiibacteriota bacterium]